MCHSCLYSVYLCVAGVKVWWHELVSGHLATRATSFGYEATHFCKFERRFPAKYHTPFTYSFFWVLCRVYEKDALVYITITSYNWGKDCGSRDLL